MKRSPVRVRPSTLPEIPAPSEVFSRWVGTVRGVGITVRDATRRDATRRGAPRRWLQASTDAVRVPAGREAG